VQRKAVSANVTDGGAVVQVAECSFLGHIVLDMIDDLTKIFQFCVSYPGEGQGVAFMLMPGEMFIRVIDLVDECGHKTTESQESSDSFDEPEEREKEEPELAGYV
jgi:hypothetical protein